MVEHLLEVIDMPDSGPVAVGRPIDRATAFARLADDHLDAAYRLARAILHDSSDAQDATHDALIQAFRKWPTLRDTSLFERWFDRILVNICRNRLQQANRRQATDISLEVAIAAGDAFGQADDHHVLGKAIERLSPDHRLVVALRYYRDLPVDEIAARLGIPAGTVRSRLHHALKDLHRMIDPPGARETVR